MLRATGGALSLEKSYWYLIEVIRKDGTWTFSTVQDSPGNIQLNAVKEDGSPWEAERLEPRRKVDEAKEMLGIWACPDGLMSKEKAEIIKSVRTWCDRLRTTKVNRHEAEYCLRSTIMRIIEYPLMATTFSKKDIHEIMSPLLCHILPLCGFQKHMPRALIFGSHRFQGWQLHDPWHTQLIEHLHLIL